MRVYQDKKPRVGNPKVINHDGLHSFEEAFQKG